MDSIYDHHVDQDRETDHVVCSSQLARDVGTKDEARLGSQRGLVLEG